MSISSRRRAKIVCTLGPASSSREIIETLVGEGMDIARLNFSHGTHETHKKNIDLIRKVSQATKKPVAIMQDLQGPKMRIGDVGKAGMEVKTGDRLLLYPEGSKPKKTGKGRIPLPITSEYAEIISKSVRKGSKILFDDGKIMATVVEVTPPEFVVEAENAGKLTNHKGMNLPGTPLPIPCLTPKDLKDLQFGLDQKVDAVALSFVRSPEDIDELLVKIKKFSNHRPLIVAKIEQEEAVAHIDQILAKIDALLIARGDMAVELGPENVPTIQKKLIFACNQKGVPVITATQMLESMVSSPTPTRAEASDVANAVYDGTDAVMLSAETASGTYPVETVQTMVRIILEAERSREENSRHTLEREEAPSVVDAIERSAAKIAEKVGARCIACITRSGMAVRTLAKYRPSTSMLAIVDNEETLRRLAFVWGVRGIVIPEIGATDDLFEEVETLVRKNGFAEAEDLIVVTAGVPTLKKGTTNMVKVQRIGAEKSKKR